MSKDLIFVFFGGTMSGTFGAGVSTALQSLNVNERIDSIYATSAGAHNAAYLISEETNIGSSIYYENLINNEFLELNKSKLIYKMLASLFTSNNKLKKIINIDYLIDIEKNAKKLDTEKIANSNINFFIRVFNVNERKEQYLDGKSETLIKLNATTAIVPFYPRQIMINGVRSCNGDTLSVIIDPELEKMINANPDKKIYFVFNNKDKERNSFAYLMREFIWTLFLMKYFKSTFALRKLKVKSENAKLNKYLKYPNIKIIEPDFSTSVFCTDKNKLLKAYENGLEKTMNMFSKNNGD
ncbi:MAG: patatin-like phospholipase family protein [Patescibacteria group bacterium]|jgi:predicted patatin/cPLA2 family phospholipase